MPPSVAFCIPTEGSNFSASSWVSFLPLPVSNLSMKRWWNKPNSLKPNSPKRDWIHINCQLPATNPQQIQLMLKKTTHCPLRGCVPGNHPGPSTWRGCPCLDMLRSTQEGLGSSQGYTSPGISWLPPPLACSVLPIANIASDYAEKLCQSFLCLREGHLSFPLLNLKTS